MHRYTLTLPLEDNDGVPLDETHAILEDWLLDRVGGFTSTDSVGAWRGADGTTYREAVRVYAVDTAELSWPDLQAMAASFATHARQEAVYVTRQSIDAAAVEPTLAPIEGK